MKLRFLAVIGLVCVCAVAQAATPAAQKKKAEIAPKSDPATNVSFGTFSISDSDVKDIVGTGFGFTVDRELRATHGFDLRVSFSYVGFSNSFEGMSIKETLIPITLRAVKELDIKTKMKSSQIKPYVGLGLGMVRMSTDVEDISESNTDRCVELIGGVKFGTKAFAELKMLRGSRRGNTGVGFNLGAKF